MPSKARVEMKVRPEEIRKGDRFSKGGVLYEVIEAEGIGRLSVYGFTCRVVTPHHIGVDYSDEVTIYREERDHA